MAVLTYNSARHSIRIVEPPLADIVDEVEAAASNSARTATMTAAISYISRGHSLIV